MLDNPKKTEPLLVLLAMKAALYAILSQRIDEKRSSYR
jgi:hypothetical protein